MDGVVVVVVVVVGMSARKARSAVAILRDETVGLSCLAARNGV